MDGMVYKHVIDPKNGQSSLETMHRRIVGIGNVVRPSQITFVEFLEFGESNPFCYEGTFRLRTSYNKLKKHYALHFWTKSCYVSFKLFSFSN